MSVIMTLSLKGDAKKLEEHAASDPDAMHAIVESAKGHGLIAHRFYGSEDGEIMVVDEWPDEQSFLSFFEENGGEDRPADAGRRRDLGAAAQVLAQARHARRLRLGRIGVRQLAGRKLRDLRRDAR